MKLPQKEDLTKLSEYIWEIPQGFRGDMRVPARIFASEKMLDDLFKDISLWQLVNMTTLPGAYKYALAMPDVHEGYGFCLTKEAQISTSLGYFLKIKDLEYKFENIEALTFDKKSKKLITTKIDKFFKLKPYTKILRIITEAGFALTVTSDHPIYTRSGIKKAGELTLDDEIIVYGFGGVAYKEPPEEIIVDERDILRVLKSSGLANVECRYKIIVEKLKIRKLLPLSYNNPKLPYLLKIAAFVFGDATMNFIGKKKDGVIHFYGEKEDLLKLKEDLKILGYNSSKIYSQGDKCYSVDVNASSLVVLLEALGVPRGRKVNKKYRMPKWLFKAPLWQKRLFLATLFGCELRTPHRRKERKFCFNAPVFPMNKNINLIENGKQFLKDIAKLCQEFGVKTTKINQRREIISKDGNRTICLELVFSSETESLINLWSKIGFEYNQKKLAKASVYSIYLRLKKRILEKRSELKINILELLKNSLSYVKIAESLSYGFFTKRFVVDYAYRLKSGLEHKQPKIPTCFIPLKKFLKTKALGNDGLCFDKVEKIEEIKYSDFVYDFRVNNENHNFIANNFIVSNCVGGVLATLKDEGGNISPGGVGFDINCLHPESEILTEFGYFLPIKNIKKENLPLIDKERKELKKGEIALVLRRKENDCLYSIKTKLGYEIKVTADHPIYTLRGMIAAEKLKEGEKIIIYPFKGSKYQKPKRILLTEEKDVYKAFKKLNLNKNGNAYKQVINWLKEKKFIPLYLNDNKIPYLIKILGYIFGDGSITYLKKTKKLCSYFYGRYEDLSKIQGDLKKLNINSKIYTRKRVHKLKNTYGKNYEFEYIESCLKISSTAFSLLLYLLGAPLGKKTEKEFHLPSFLKRSPLWYKRLFLASFFGAELSINFICSRFDSLDAPVWPSLTLRLKHSPTAYPSACWTNRNLARRNRSLTKSLSTYSSHNTLQFMNEIKDLLLEFDIQTSDIKVIEKLGIKGKTVGLRMKIKSELNNLLRFFEIIGFEYNQEKQKLACLGAGYLRYKKKIIEERKLIRERVKELFKQKVPIKELVALYSGPYTPKNFIEHSAWSDRGLPRISFVALGFGNFVKEYSFGNSGFLIDEIEEIKKESYQGYVYDLTINDKNHNFIANNFVVSNCGVRLLVSPFYFEEIKEKIPKLTEEIYKEVPSGVGEGGFWRLNNDEMNKVLTEGAKWLYEIGYAEKEDLSATESYGRLEGSDPDKVSKTAKDRGRNQLGTIGAGNHFVEIQRVAEVFDEEISKKLGLEKNKVCLLIHCGSRGLGHQVATDYIKEALRYLDKRNIELVDRELAYFPFESEEGKNYFSAMKAAANFAFANRQLITYEIRKAFKKVFAKDIELKQVYDVAHNIVKEEIYDGKKLLIHRKGATRAFPSGHSELPKKYQEIGQPTLIPGSMGTSSYVLIGQPLAMEISFGSSPHGAGRMMSRTEAKRKIRGSELKKDLEKRGIFVAAGSLSGLAEEAPVAYKDVSEVVEVVHQIGIAEKIVKLIPIGVIKG